MKQMRTAFITGFLVLVPLLATIDILLWFVDSVDTSARKFFPTAFLPFDFSGLGLILAILLIFLTGLLTQNYVGKWFVNLVDGLLRRVPGIGGIYSGIKKCLETILNPRSDQFNGTVLVEFPRTGMYSIGFRTGRPDAKILKAGKNLVNVFVPCTPNPTSGFYILVPEEQLVPLEMSVQEAFKIVVSMGMVTSEDKIGTKL